MAALKEIHFFLVTTSGEGFSFQPTTLTLNTKEKKEEKSLWTRLPIGTLPSLKTSSDLNSRKGYFTCRNKSIKIVITLICICPIYIYIFAWYSSKYGFNMCLTVGVLHLKPEVEKVLVLMGLVLSMT